MCWCGVCRLTFSLCEAFSLTAQKCATVFIKSSADCYTNRDDNIVSSGAINVIETCSKCMIWWGLEVFQGWDILLLFVKNCIFMKSFSTDSNLQLIGGTSQSQEWGGSVDKK